jgi:DNA-binding HxlR family transcriptional regulator
MSDRRTSVPAPGRRVRGSRTGRPVMALLDLLGRRWVLRILWELRDSRAASFRELQSRCGDVSSSVLNQRLRALHGLDAWATRWGRRAASAQ